MLFEETIYWLGYALVCLMLLTVSMFLLLAVVVGARRLRRMAAKRGQATYRSYIASWIVLFPLMLVVCLVHGGAILYQNRD
ncbi:MAG: hypothetical protein R6V45_09575 [Oceanipulchritudo sp.]